MEILPQVLLFSPANRFTSLLFVTLTIFSHVPIQPSVFLIDNISDLLWEATFPPLHSIDGFSLLPLLLIKVVFLPAKFKLTLDFSD